MIMNPKHIVELSYAFHNLTWVLGLNETHKTIYTSDNPICTWAHIKHPFLSMNGIASKGVEVFFPLSPHATLIMIDGEYHTGYKSLDRKYIKITGTEDIDRYNSILAVEANRFIYSTEGDWTLIDNMIKKSPDVFDQPHTQLTWGGKVYTPTRTK